MYYNCIIIIKLIIKIIIQKLNELKMVKIVNMVSQ